MPESMDEIRAKGRMMIKTQSKQRGGGGGGGGGEGGGNRTDD